MYLSDYLQEKILDILSSIVKGKKKKSVEFESELWQALNVQAVKGLEEISASRYAKLPKSLWLKSKILGNVVNKG